MTTLLETRGLGKDYGDLRAVDALDLEVARGEIFGLLGPNGAGKTTAISMIAGVVTPSRGRARIAGYDISREPLRARAELGLVPQEIALYEDLSARQNLRFFGSLYRLSGATLHERIDWALEVAGLRDRDREPISRYSGGMKRRLNLVAGLLHRPRLLILDEPTVGVDPQSRNYLFETVRSLAGDGMAILYTSHYMEEVEALCPQVGIIDHGTLIALDRVESLVTEHGGGGFEIEVGEDPGAALAALGGLGDAELDGGRIRVAPAAGLGAVVRAIEDTGAEILSVRSQEANLETVFLTLTGKTLRDDA